MQDQLLQGPQSQPKKGKFKGIPLNQNQVAKAKEMIKVNHPLSDTPVSQVFPLFRPILKCFDKKNQTHQLPLLDEENKNKVNKKGYQLSEEQKEDPYNELGFGMVAYRDLMFTLICLFTFLSLLMSPAIYFYGSGTGVQTPSSTYDVYTMGNLGYSTSQCQTVPVDLQNIPMICSYGVVSEVFYIGINPEGSSNKQSCSDSTQANICNDALNPTYIQAIKDSVASNKNAASFEQGFTYEDIFTNYTTTDAKCTSKKAYLYTQYACKQTDEVLKDKHKQASIISSLAVFLVCVYMITIYWFKRVSKLVQIDWDIQTITPGDYTVQYEITDQAYKWFLQHIFPRDRDAGLSTGESLKTYIKNELECILTDKLRELKATGQVEGNIKISEVKIADISFAFNNAELINLLRVRGSHIMNQRYDAMREVEAQISQLKDTKFNELVKPCDAFITFEEEDGGIIAQEFEPKFTFSGKKLPADREFMGDELFLVESTEPTNIIWENRYFTTADYVKKTLVALAIISVLLTVSFAVMFVCKMFAIQKGNMYPDVDCNQVKTIYPNDMQGWAYREYLAYYNVTNGESAQPFSGVLQCHCKDVQAAKGNLFTYSVNSTNICEDYIIDTYLILGFSSSVSYMIVAINYILRIFIIKIILYIGKDTESEKTKLITNGVFITQFFNTALLLLSVNANLKEQGSFTGAIFTGGISDFDETWFTDIGQTLVGAMIFNVYWPVLEFFLYLGIRNLIRILDRSFKCDDTITKKTTIQNYIEIYSGPQFFIHYKYSSILNITFVTMMYGVGLPLLFPVAAGSFFTLYIIEKIMIHYCYRQPPMYDEKINNNVLNLMTFAPLLFLSFGYWMLSSKQLLANDITPFVDTTDATITGHVWTDVFTAEAYGSTKAGMPLLVMFWIFLFGVIFREILYKHITKCLPSLRIGHFEIDEDLDNYFRTLDDNDREWSIKEEEYSRQTMNLKVLADETLTKLKTLPLGDSVMKGVHNYDILSNPAYVKDFQYISPATENRAEYIIDDDDDEDNDNAQSDLVKMILNLAFLTEKKAIEFSFNKSAYSKQVVAKKGIN